MSKMNKRVISILLAMVMIIIAGIPGVYGQTALADAVPAAANVVSVDDIDVGTVDFNEGWQFYLATRTPSVAVGNNNASNFASYGLKDEGVDTDDVIKLDYDDSDWRTLTLPHDFSIEGNKVETSNDSQAYLEGGLGWYRKTFTLPESMRNKRIVIDFEGVYQNSNVYLNGELVGNYPNGYTGFAYDLSDTGLLNFGEDNPNVITVKVQNMSPSGRWYTGSGITRPVSLKVSEQVSFNRNGVTVTSPRLEEIYDQYGAALVEIEASTYSTATNGRARMDVYIYDQDGNEVVKSIGQDKDTNPSTKVNFDSSLELEDVNLWYPWTLSEFGTPYLYTVRVELLYKANGSDGDYEMTDYYETTYGFRWIDVEDTVESDPNSGGFYINGEYMKIQGVDLHHDSGALGAASYKDAFERQFEKLQSYGVNAYRTSHCPPSKQVIEVCNEMGFVVVEEAFDGWGGTKATYDFGAFFMKEVPSTVDDAWAGLYPNGILPGELTPAVNYSGAQYTWSDWVVYEMVSRDINDPSVVMWSIGNEVRGLGSTPGWYDVEKYNPLNVSGMTGINFYTEAVRLGEAVKATDDTRLVLMGGDQQRSGASGYWVYVNRYLDGYGLNYNTAKSVDGLMTSFPQTFFFESESSSQTSSRGVYLDASLRNTGVNETPGRRGGSNYDNDFASWTMSNEYGLKKDRDRKNFIGQFIWTGFDYLGEPTPYGVYPVGASSFGVMDTAGFPKDSYYLYQSQWLDGKTDPMVHVLPGDWDNWEEGEEVDVWVNSNLQTVELFLNGNSLGVKSFDLKETAYGKKYYETSEYINDDKSWGDSANPSGYTSTGATILKDGESSEIDGGTNFGRLHLTWQVPYEEGTLTAKAYSSLEAYKAGEEPVTVDVVSSSGSPYSIEMEAWREVIQADGRSLTYVECTIVDENGNEVPDAANLVKFDVTGGAIVGVDNGQQESTELYKWESVERNSHSERSAYAGKVLVILQSNKGETGTMYLTASADGLHTNGIAITVTEDGTGTYQPIAHPDPVFSSVEDVTVTVPTGVVPTLTGVVKEYFNNGEYYVNTAVQWDDISENQVQSIGSFDVSGVTANGNAAKAVITVSDEAEKENIALNTGLGSGNDIFSFDQLAETDELRNGALATATFTGSKSNYPNNMLNGSTGSSWTNQYSRGASVLLAAVSASRPAEYVEFFWDGARVFDEIELYFTTNLAGSLSIPASMNVQYWDGANWIDAENQSVNKATASQQATTLTFDAVTAERVRVYLENATPYTSTGNMQITMANIFGWNFNESVVIPPKDDEGGFKDLGPHAIELDLSTAELLEDEASIHGRSMGGYVQISHSRESIFTDYTVDGKSFTIEAWYKPSASATDDVIVSKGNAGYSLKTHRRNADVLEFNMYNGTAWNTIEATIPNHSSNWAGKWHHVAGIYDGNTMHLYLDGEILTTDTNITNGNAENEYDFVINGRHYNNAIDGVNNGEIASVRLYSDALSVAQLDKQTAKEEAVIQPSDSEVVFWFDYKEEETYFENVFLNKPTTASSENVGGRNGDETADRAVDGNTSTKWCAADGTYPQWLQVDLEDTYLIHDIDLVLETLNDAYNFTISVSDAPNTWTENEIVIDRRNNTSNTDRSFDINAVGRYVRVTFTAPDAKNAWAVIAEMSGSATKGALPSTGDKTELQGLVDIIEGLNEADYTEESWNVLQAALAAAQSVLSSQNAAQVEIDKALEDLKEAYDNLAAVPVDGVDKTLLRLLVEEAERLLDSEEYANAILEVQESFLAVYNRAAAMLDDNTADKAAVMARASELGREIRKLGFQAGDKEALLTLYTTLSDTNLDLYPDGDEKDKFKAALENAEKVLADPRALEAEVTEAYERLSNAFADLTAYDYSLLLDVLVLAKEAAEEINLLIDYDQERLTNAIAEAEALVGNAESQEEIDRMAQKLFDVYVSLRYRADKSVLEQVLGEADMIYNNLSKYTEESQKVFIEAYLEAQDVMKNGNIEVKDQDAVDYVVRVLRDAIDNMEENTEKPGEPGDKTELNNLLEKASELDKDDYTANSWDAYLRIKEEAEKVQQDEDAVQTVIDAVVSKLKDAIESLVNISELKEAVTDAEKLNAEDYTSDSWKTFEDALEKATELLKDAADPTAVITEVQVQEALKALEDAEAGLKPAEGTDEADKTELKKLIDKADALKESNYSSGWAAFQKALVDAKEVYSNPDATQKAVDQAADALKKAMDALVEIEPDTDPTDSEEPKQSETESDTARQSESDTNGAKGGDDGKGGSNSGKTNAKTGDSTSLILLFMLLMVSGLGIAVIYKKRITK